ncbi:MAG: hypothetical protein ACK5WY_01965 [Holosporaceae bacterium]|jgi:hypothetical protein|nr:hypothetical protein [Rhodospirillaceae bacterium]
MDAKLFINLILGKIFLIVVLFHGFGWVESLAKTPAIRNIAAISSGQGIYASTGQSGGGINANQNQQLLSLASKLQSGDLATLTSADQQSLQQLAGQLSSSM